MKEWQIAAFILGTNGEFFALSMEEKISIMREARRMAPPGMTLCARVGSVTTLETVRLAREAARSGMDLLAVITPYFIPLTRNQLERHYRQIAKSVQMPIVLYNIPQRTGNSLSVETVAALASVPNMVGLKGSSGDLDYIGRVLASVPDYFSVFVGSDGLILGALKAGAAGSVSGMANLVPETIIDICQSFLDGWISDSEMAQAELAAIRETFAFGNSNSIVKQAVRLAGQRVWPCRNPGEIRDPEIDGKIVAVLERAGISIGDMVV